MNNNNKKDKIKKPINPRTISKSKYFIIGARDSARIRIIKEGMNHLFDQRNAQLEEAFYHEALQYAEKIIGATRRIDFTEEEDQENMNMIFGGVEQNHEEDHEAMDVIFNNTVEDQVEGSLSVEEVISGQEEERREAEDESETDTEEVLALQERIEQEDQEEYDRIRAELDEEEKANNDN